MPGRTFITMNFHVVVLLHLNYSCSRGLGFYCGQWIFDSPNSLWTNYRNVGRTRWRVVGRTLAGLCPVYEKMCVFQITFSRGNWRIARGVITYTGRLRNDLSRFIGGACYEYTATDARNLRLIMRRRRRRRRRRRGRPGRERRRFRPVKFLGARSPWNNRADCAPIRRRNSASSRGRYSGTVITSLHLGLRTFCLCQK